MNENQLQHMKTHIESELASVNARVAALKRVPKPEELESGGDNTPFE